MLDLAKVLKCSVWSSGIKCLLFPASGTHSCLKLKCTYKMYPVCATTRWFSCRTITAIPLDTVAVVEKLLYPTFLRYDL